MHTVHWKVVQCNLNVFVSMCLKAELADAHLCVQGVTGGLWNRDL